MIKLQDNKVVKQSSKAFQEPKECFWDIQMDFSQFLFRVLAGVNKYTSETCTCIFHWGFE